MEERDYSLPLYYKYNFNQLALGILGIFAGLIIFYFIVTGPLFAVKFLAIIYALVALLLLYIGVSYVQKSLPYLLHSTYLAVTTQGIQIFEDKKRNRGLIAWSDIRTIEPLGEKIVGIMVSVKDKEKYFSKLDLKMISKGGTDEEVVRSTPVTIVCPELAGNRKYLLDILNEELRRQRD